MCDQCTGNSPDDKAGDHLPAKSGLSRRALLAVGTSLVTGVVLGLWQCQSPTAETQPATTSEPASATTATTPASTGNATQPATTQTTPTQSSQSTPATQTTPSTQTTSAPVTPDLGSELFPDPANPAGTPLAHAADAPVIMVPRTDWTTARPDLAHIAPMDGISRITIHHTAGQIQTDAWKPTANELEGIREFHAGTRPTDRNWADIAYHFAIDRAGRVWQARPLAYQGAHARGHNAHNLGIVLLGNFAIQSPSAAQLTSLALFIAFTRQLYKVSLDNVFTHGELVDTECPGPLLQDYMNRARTVWGESYGTPWRKAATYPASDPAK